MIGITPRLSGCLVRFRCPLKTFYLARMTALDREMFQAIAKDLSPEKRARAAVFLAHFQGRFGAGMGPGMERGPGGRHERMGHGPGGGHRMGPGPGGGGGMGPGPGGGGGMDYAPGSGDGVGPDDGPEETMGW